MNLPDYSRRLASALSAVLPDGFRCSVAPCGITTVCVNVYTPRMVSRESPERIATMLEPDPGEDLTVTVTKLRLETQKACERIGISPVVFALAKSW